MVLEENIQVFSEFIQESIKKELKDVAANVFATGCANLGIAKISFPPFISISVDLDQNAKAAVKRIVDRINKELQDKNVAEPGEELCVISELHDMTTCKGKGYYKICSTGYAEETGTRTYTVTKEDMDLYCMASSLERRNCENPMDLINKVRKMKENI